MQDHAIVISVRVIGHLAIIYHQIKGISFVANVTHKPLAYRGEPFSHCCDIYIYSCCASAHHNNSLNIFIM